MRKTKLFSDVLTVSLLIYNINNNIHNIPFNLLFEELGIWLNW